MTVVTWPNNDWRLLATVKRVAMAIVARPEACGFICGFLPVSTFSRGLSKTPLAFSVSTFSVSISCSQPGFLGPLAKKSSTRSLFLTQRPGMAISTPECLEAVFFALERRGIFPELPERIGKLVCGLGGLRVPLGKGRYWLT